MFPEESVQAAKVAGARVIMPVHWAGFALAQHHWKDPLERFVKACKDTTQRFTVPLLGEIVASERTESSLKSWIDLE